MKVITNIGKFLIIVLVTIVIAVVALGSSAVLGFAYIKQTTVQNQGGTVDNPVDNSASKPKDSINVLILGMNQNLSDFIMLARYNPSTGNVSLLSIPRDTKYNGLNEPHNTYYKINAVYQRKHIDKIKDKIQTMLDVEIDNYLVFDKKALCKVVDAIGGVTVDVPMNMNYDDPEQGLHIHLSKGVQRLNGEQAEGFVRFRKNNDGLGGYPGGDIQRIQTQQAFIKAFISECLKPKNVIKLPGIAKDVMSDVKTDVTIDKILYYLEDIATFNMDKVTITTLPGYDQMLNGVSFYIMKKSETKELIDVMFKDKQPVITE